MNHLYVRVLDTLNLQLRILVSEFSLLLKKYCGQYGNLENEISDAFESAVSSFKMIAWNYIFSHKNISDENVIFIQKIIELTAG